jgi:hypothetical protein
VRSPVQISEKEYVSRLESERRMFAWCLNTYGSIALPEAQSAAESRYPYEPAGDSSRGLIFHDEAWHWAMLHMLGEGYWRARPELETPSPEYRVEASRQVDDT